MQQYYSFGIYIVHHRNEIQEAFKVPLLYAVIIGLVVNLLKIPIPQVIFTPIEMVGMITIPLALLVLGYKLTEIKISAAKTASLASVFRILGGFLVAFLLIKLFSIDGLVKDIIVLQAAMPSAVILYHSIPLLSHLIPPLPRIQPQAYLQPLPR
ncbi:MAG: AEC family transporter [Methanophagales archaeon]|nr:AEC family transporter [Methanophagales archaeon]